MQPQANIGVATAPMVPFVDLQRHHAMIGDELRLAFDAVLADGGFVLGEEVEAFESEFSRYCGVTHCVGVSSGTAALTLAMLAAGIGPGDEVIVPAHTYIATALSVRHAGAEPVFCDVQDGTGLISIQSATDLLSPRTVAIMPVHLYGQACDMGAVTALAARHGLLVIEDAAQAHGARFGAKRAGSLGDVAAFSFYPSKNLGALGDGGAICTDDDEIAARGRRLRNLGQRRKGEHIDRGFNERLDGIQAAMLRVKLRDLEERNALRQELAAIYREVLPDACRMLDEHPPGECVYHLFPTRVEKRDEVRRALAARGVDTAVHYWPAVHRQPPFASSALPASAPEVAVRWSEEELSLPMFPELTAGEVRAVGEAFDSALEEVAL
jgi:dTDP-4-amino-4,6-dideoxygalactose transaminase